MTSEFSLAVHALVYLCRKQQTVCSDVLARSVCTNPARVRKVMLPLKAAGLIGAKEGPDGGYYLLLPPESITLDMLAQALNIALVRPVWRFGQTDMPCVIASGLADVMEDLSASLNQSCYAHLSRISIRDIDASIPSQTQALPLPRPAARIRG